MGEKSTNQTYLMDYDHRLAELDSYSSSLEDLLDRDPLIAAPNMSLREVIFLMTQSWSSTHLQSEQIHADQDSELPPIGGVSNAVLMISNGTLKGIFTERDLVRLVSRGEAILDREISEFARTNVITRTISDFQNLFSLLIFMRQHHIRHLPILDDQGEIMGLVTPERLRQSLQPADILKFRAVKDILTTTVISTVGSASVKSATQKMTQHQVSCVVIVEGDRYGEILDKDSPSNTYDTPIGMITERDIVQFQQLELNLEQTQVRDVMSAPLYLIKPEDSVWHAHKMMNERQIRRLVVVSEHGELMGVVTQSTVLQTVDPAEMYGVMQLMQQKMSDLERENVRLLEERSIALEHEVQLQTRERREAEQLLVDQEKSYQALTENLPAIVYQLFPNEHNRMVFMNNQLKTLTGFEVQELYSGDVCSIDPLIVEADRHMVITTVKDAIDLNYPFELAYRIENKAGHIRYFWEQGQPILDEDDGLNHYDGVIFDVTDLKEAKLALEQERDFNDAILETAGALILVLDPEGRIIRFNQACERLTGYTFKELQQSLVWDSLIPLEEFEQVQTIFKQLLQGNHPNQHQNHWISKSGITHLINWSNTVLTNATSAVSYIIAIGIDITEQQKLQEQFLRAQRLESIGTLASGISHDLNNILTPILAISQLLPLRIPDLDPESQHLLEVMQKSAKRGSELVHQVLKFSRGLSGDRTSLQLRHIISEIRNIASKTFPKSIEFWVDIPNDLWNVNGDPTQLHQVFMNLCINARDAMPEGGQLQITALNVSLDDTFSQSHFEAQTGPYVLITLSDTGIGIPAADLDKIFEPFFSTKTPHQGTGLGLSTVHGIIKNHGGFITVYSEQNKGSQFKIYLPAIESSESLKVCESDIPKGQGELILVIDDEAPIREITKTVLETYQYRVLTGSDGIEAIALYAQHQSDINVVLMDMTMPTMDGITAVQTLQKINPEIKIILNSGLAANEKIAFTMGKGIKAFISKPFSSSTLLRTLSTILKEHQSSDSLH